VCSRYPGQRIPRRREIRKLEAEGLDLHSRPDSSGAELAKKVVWGGQCSGADARNRGRTSEAPRSLLKQHDVALLRPRPHRRNKPSTRPENADDLTSCRLAVDDVHHAETGDHNVERGVLGGNDFRASLEEGEIAQMPGGRATPRESEHLWADVHTNDSSAWSNDRSGPSCGSARTRPEVEDPLARAQGGTADQCLHDGKKPPVDFTNVGVRDPVPDARLPGETFLFPFRINHLP